MMRQNVAVLAVACALCAPMAWTADDEFVGKWTIKQEFQGQERVSTLSIEKAESGLKGTMENRRGTNDLSNVKVTDGKLTFTRTIDRQGQSFSIDYEATIKDGKLAGKMITPRGEREFTASREGGGEVSFIGAWDVLLDFQGREVKATLEVTDDDGKLAGKWTSQRGEADLDNVKIAEGKLTFSRDMERQGQSFTIEYSATIEDGKLVGAMDTPMGAMEFTGTQAKQEEADPDLARAKQMMEFMDANKDGKVTEDEAPEQMKAFFSMIDSNGDGSVDVAELKAVVPMMGGQGGQN